MINYILADKVWYTNGMARYSDLSMIILGMLVEHITHVPLEVFAAKEIFEPASLPSVTSKLGAMTSRLGYIPILNYLRKT